MDIVKDWNVQENIVPLRNKVLVELITEGDTWGNTNIEKLDTSKTIEPYVFVLGVGESVKTILPGNFVLLRTNFNPLGFKIGNKRYALIDDFNLEAVISKEMTEVFRNEIMSAETKNQIMN